MKVQLHGQHLRLRIDESELAALRAGAALENVTVVGARAWRQVLRQGSAADAPMLLVDANECAITIPRALIDTYAGRLPCREGLVVAIRAAEGSVLEVALEVDVRDSVRARGPHRKS